MPCSISHTLHFALSTLAVSLPLSLIFSPSLTLTLSRSHHLTLSLSIYIYLSISLSVSLSLSHSLTHSLYLSLSFSLSLRLSLSLSLYFLPLSLCLRLSLSLSLSLFVFHFQIGALANVGLATSKGLIGYSVNSTGRYIGFVFVLSNSIQFQDSWCYTVSYDTASCLVVSSKRNHFFESYCYNHDESFCN